MNIKGSGRRVLLAVSLLAGVALAGSALARGDGGEGCGGKGAKGHHGEGRLEKRIDALELDTTTREAVDAVLAVAREERRAQHEEMRNAREQLHALLQQDVPDEASVMVQADEVGALQVAARKAQLRTLFALREQLTPEQWTQLAETLESRRGSGRHGRHGPRRSF